MAKKKKVEVPLELRATRVNPKIYNACIDSAKKNLRTISNEIEYQLSKAYNINV